MSNRTKKLKLLWAEIRGFFAGQEVELLPARHGWSGYQRTDIWADLRSGINVALLALPQGMAFALIAGVAVPYGIACAAVAAVAAALFCHSSHIALGPTNATAFTVFSFFATYPALGARQDALMPLLAILLAILFITGAFLHVAELVQYISRSVMVGYISGAALLIMTAQMKDVLGIMLANPGETMPRTFFTTMGRLMDRAAATSPASVAMAACTILILLGLEKWRPRWPSFALALAGTTALACALAQFFPAFAGLARLESFVINDLHPRLPTGSATMLDDLGALFGLAMAVAFIGALETSVMVKGMASRSGEKINLDQDMFGVGMANLASVFVGGMPVSSSLTRSAMAYNAGGKSRVAMLVNGLTVAGLALALGPLIGLVPRAVLAGLVMAVAWRLFNLRQLRICLTSTRSDAATLIVTVLATLLVPLYVAIFTGVALSVMLYLRKAAHPELVEYEFTESGALAETNARRIPAISIVHVEGDLFFGAADLFRTQVQRTMLDPMLKVIILRLRNARNLDATSVMALEDLIRVAREKNRHIIISGVTKGVYRVLRNSGVIDVLGRRNLFMHSTGNPNVSTRHALLRAQEILGTREADIQIFIDPNKKRANPMAEP